VQQYQSSNLRAYFQENALLFPVETIIGRSMKHSSMDSNNSSCIEKSQQKDFQWFLSQGNFLKVVDTLEKFEQGLLDNNSDRAKEFVLFKRQLYAMYEVQNRSVSEHELFSFEVERHNLKWVYQANVDFVQEQTKVA
jgi:hypothetical protein